MVGSKGYLLPAIQYCLITVRQHVSVEYLPQLHCYHLVDELTVLSLLKC